MKEMTNALLRDTLDVLRARPGTSDRRVTELHLTSYFATVELDGESVGARGRARQPSGARRPLGTRGTEDVSS